MKKSILSYWSHLVVILVAMFAFSSCGTEDDPSAAPIVTINPTEATIEVGQTVSFTYTVSSEERLDEIRIIARNQTVQRIVDFNSNNSHGGTFTFTGVPDDADKTITVTVEAQDKNANVGRTSVNITVEPAAQPIAIRTFRAVLMGAQSNTNPSFIDVDVDAATPRLFTYSGQQAKNNASDVDFGYLVGSSANGQGSVIGSPKDESIAAVYNDATNGVQTWSVRNDTRFKETNTSQSEFEAINDGTQILTIYENGTKPNNTGNAGLESESTRVNQLVAGKTFAFKTAAGKTGVAYVVSVSGGASGTITLDIKVAQQ